ncbi:MAG: Rieske (2Fe-2S) protein [Chloroflexi bacterium]|nr:Rieske (2Fe-2S) protein [Chloroflexota bacterium]
MAKYIVGTVDEITPGTRKIVDVGGRSVGVYNLHGEFFAILNRCPHQAGPLCLGNAYGFLKSGAVGEYEYSRPGEIVRCPWHGWEFDVRTGQSWFDPVQVRVRRYDVSVTPGAELVAEGADETLVAGTPPPPNPGTTPAEVAAATGDAGETEPGMEGMLKGPYVAETFPVSIEQQYVVVEIGR